MARKRPGLIPVLLAILIGLALLAALPAQSANPTALFLPLAARGELSTPAPTPQLYLVTHVADGDTVDVLMGGQTERVRYIGMDTPEMPAECYAQEATARNEALVLGQYVALERDVSDRDDYGRLLRYVYVDGALVNTRLVSEGYATVMTIYPDVRYAETLQLLEQQAHAAGLGLWSACANVTPTPQPSATPAGQTIEVTAWVSDSSPSQYTNVTVYGKITQGGVGVAGVPMHTVWAYKTVERTCDGTSGASGIASCTRGIGNATVGRRVDIHVQFTYQGQTYTAETGFTPG